MKIAVAGLGYVGLSMAILLSQKQEVIGFDINGKRLEQLLWLMVIFVDL
jgi:UDPglucose 6-dehydrogenase